MGAEGRLGALRVLEGRLRAGIELGAVKCGESMGMDAIDRGSEPVRCAPRKQPKLKGGGGRGRGGLRARGDGGGTELQCEPYLIDGCDVSGELVEAGVGLALRAEAISSWIISLMASCEAWGCCSSCWVPASDSGSVIVRGRSFRRRKIAARGQDFEERSHTR